MRPLQHFVLGLLVVASSALSRGALASPSYPGVVRDTLGLTCTPQCIVCHTTNEGGPGHINLFGDTITGAGGRALSDQSIRNALANIAKGLVGRQVTPTAPYDSDGDGVDDITELKVGDLPAVAGDPGKGLACSAVEYGCGARIAPRPPPQSPASLAALGTVLLFVGSRLRRRRPVRR